MHQDQPLMAGFGLAGGALAKFTCRLYNGRRKPVFAPSGRRHAVRGDTRRNAADFPSPVPRGNFTNGKEALKWTI